ncbi:SoxR reducing system RseC family protein [Poseidonocella sp. HB161398]|uniref:SoxR reducing system RseC family protein n=1 Tax=Poseidonocella sp. HB161398 TaxID=2320855 RepID=UPI0014860168|nr:SoxR reducing system RseC family protein [Poseidonocella sp. HB161398]
MAGSAPSRRQLRQTLKVVSAGDGYAELEAARAEACGACAGRAGCGAGALAEMAAKGDCRTLRLPTEMGLAPGDRVVVAMESGAFLSAAMRAYLLPPAALALTAAISAAAGLPDLIAALLCLPALALALLPLRQAERRGRLGGSLRIEGRAPDAPQ